MMTLWSSYRANEGNIDLEYLRMMNHIKNKVDLSDLPANSELRKVSGGLNNLALVELELKQKRKYSGRA